MTTMSFSSPVALMYIMLMRLRGTMVTVPIGILLTSPASLILTHIILLYTTYNRTTTNELSEIYCLVYSVLRTSEELKLLCNWKCQCSLCMAVLFIILFKNLTMMHTHYIYLDSIGILS